MSEEIDSADLIAKTNKKFINVGAYGGYAPVGVNPGQSTMRYSGEEKEITSDFATYYMGSEAIDVNAFQILRNMASRLSLDE